MRETSPKSLSIGDGDGDQGVSLMLGRHHEGETSDCRFDGQASMVCRVEVPHYPEITAE